MKTRAKPEPPVPTPLLDALYESDLDLGTQEFYTAYLPEDVDIAMGDKIPAFRKDALGFTQSDRDRFHRMSLNWEKQKGEPAKRKSPKKWRKTTTKKRKGKPKRKLKWIPRKEYFAAKRRKAKRK